MLKNNISNGYGCEHQQLFLSEKGRITSDKWDVFKKVNCIVLKAIFKRPAPALSYQKQNTTTPHWQRGDVLNNICVEWGSLRLSDWPPDHNPEASREEVRWRSRAICIHLLLSPASPVTDARFLTLHSALAGLFRVNGPSAGSKVALVGAGRCLMASGLI